MSVRLHDVLWIECATCKTGGPGPDVIVREWDGHTYGLRCGHDHHLDLSKGGCKTWVATPEPRNAEVPPVKGTEHCDA